MEEPKLIDIREFVEQGFLQEVNRQFLHPHGLALSVIVNDNGTYEFAGVWDYRDDPEGIIYDLKNSEEERLVKFKEKRDNVLKEFLRHENERDKIFNGDNESPHRHYGIESIPDINKKSKNK